MIQIISNFPHIFNLKGRAMSRVGSAFQQICSTDPSKPIYCTVKGHNIHTFVKPLLQHPLCFFFFLVLDMY